MQKRLKRGQETTPEKKREKERERERKIKKEGREYTRVHGRLSPLKYTRATRPASSLFPHKFSRKLVSEIRHFSHPRWLPLPLLLLLSSLYVPCTSRLLHTYAASIVVPLFYEKLALDKRSTGKIELPAYREHSPFRSPLSTAFRAHYALVIAIRSLTLFFSSLSIL